MDLTKKEAQDKVAKFILSAANREPGVAAQNFDGHAIMIIGLNGNELKGVPFFELIDLEKRVVKFVGNPGPPWHLETIQVSSSHYVVIIVVAPPVAANQPWICHHEGSANLSDGLILMRGEGSSRPATADEIRSMILRANRPLEDSVSLSVNILTEANAYFCNMEAFEAFLSRKRDRLLEALDDSNASVRTKLQLAAWTRSTPEKRTRAQYLAEIDRWESDCREGVLKLLDECVSCVLPGTVIEVKNENETYLEGLEVNVHIDGAIDAVGKSNQNTPPNLLKDLPRAPRPWGPTVENVIGIDPSIYTRVLPTDFGTFRSVNFENGGSVSLSLERSELRPRATYRSPDDELVLIVREQGLHELTGTWTVTVKGRNKIYSGDVHVKVGDRIPDLSKWLDRSLHEESSSDTTSD